MRPLVYSAMAAAKRGIGWTRVGTDLYYAENGVARRDKVCVFARACACARGVGVL